MPQCIYTRNCIWCHFTETIINVHLTNQAKINNNCSGEHTESPATPAGQYKCVHNKNCSVWFNTGRLYVFLKCYIWWKICRCTQSVDLHIHDFTTRSISIHRIVGNICGKQYFSAIASTFPTKIYTLYAIFTGWNTQLIAKCSRFCLSHVSQKL